MEVGDTVLRIIQNTYHTVWEVGEFLVVTAGGVYSYHVVLKG
jgi:hypothetical protein